MPSSSPVQFGPEILLLTVVAGNITKAGTTAAMVNAGARRSSGRYIFRFKSTVDVTIGDGTNAHAIAIIGKRRLGDGTLGPQEMLGFAGIPMGGAVPQIPMLAARNFSQIVELVDDFAELGLCGFAADEGAGAGTFTCNVAAILD